MAPLTGGSGEEGTGWLQEWMNWPIEHYPPSPILLKIINVYHNCGTLDLMNIHLAKSANDHFAMVSSESASFRHTLKIKTFQEWFQGRSVSAFLLLIHLLPSLAALFDNFGVTPASLRLKQNLYPCRIRML